MPLIKDELRRLRSAARNDPLLRPAFPVRVRFVRGIRGRLLGECRLCLATKHQPQHFVIRISRTVDIQVQLDTLIHEWAHALNWSHQHDQDAEASRHDERWGACYSRVYRAIHGGG